MTTIKVPIHAVVVGLYIELPLKWDQHPFLRGKFLVKDESQIDLIKGLMLDFVLVDSARSRVAIPAFEPQESAATLPETKESSAEAPIEDPQVAAAWQAKQAKARALAERRAGVAAAEKDFKKTVKQVKDLNNKLKHHPAQAINEAAEVVNRVVGSLQHDRENLVHLMGANNLDDALYYHQINVSVLALLLGRSMRFSDTEMRLLGLAALLHDVGKVKIPMQIQRKIEPRSKAEEMLWRLHPAHGAEYVARFGGYDARVATIVAQHHEMVDGSGYPNGLKADQIDPMSHLVIMANYYDGLCNHVDARQSMTPHEALSLMFAKMPGKFEKAILQRLVKLLGIYPPGTVVQLSDGVLGMVLSLNQAELLRPSVMIYDPDIPKSEAVILDLNEEKDLSIKRSIRPAKLPTAVYAYLSPRERINYFFKLQENDEAASDR